jgi:SAM-dependent MidA family methyltransferase
VPTPRGRTSSGLPQPDDAAREHAARVYRHICRQIEDAGGWIPFAVFMDLALYAPALGYYAAGARKFGSEGDFVTAPEMTPLFGHTVARQVAQVLEQAGGDVVELGAGSGLLAVDILDELERLGRLPARYRILEPSAELAQRQQQRIRQRSPGMMDRVDWLESLESLESSASGFRGVVIANEVLDAIPVHILVWREEGVFERGVALENDVLVWQERPAGDSLQAAAAGIGAVAEVAGLPFVSEVSPAAAGLVSSLARGIDCGAILLIDYGFPRAEYYHPQRSSGTLMCHYRHYVHDDALFLPGLQDITAHVDFTAVAEAGVDAGCRIAYTTQAQFLINCGITELLARTPAEDMAAYLPQATAVQKLLSPAEMGELFKVLALSRGIDVPLLGFSEGDRSNRL